MPFGRLVVGKKEIWVLESGDASFALCCCTAVLAKVRVSLTAAQARELLAGTQRNIQEVLPDTSPAVREIFVTGMTPAEFDLAMNGQAKPAKDYAGLGYEFYDEAFYEFAEDDEDLDDDCREDFES